MADEEIKEKLKNKPGIPCIEELQGRKFGKLTVVEFLRTEKRKTYWKCRCDCGKMKEVKADHLKAGKVVSCGCARKDRQIEGHRVLEKTFVEGTNTSQISPDRKMNRNNKAGVRGVSWLKSKNKYRAQITFQGKTKLIGLHENLEEAAEARKKAEEEVFGEFLKKIN